MTRNGDEKDGSPSNVNVELVSSFGKIRDSIEGHGEEGDLEAFGRRDGDGEVVDGFDVGVPKTLDCSDKTFGSGEEDLWEEMGIKRKRISQDWDRNEVEGVESNAPRKGLACPLSRRKLGSVGGVERVRISRSSSRKKESILQQRFLWEFDAFPPERRDDAR